MMKGVSGAIGKTVVARQWKDGRSTLSNMPPPRNRRKIPLVQKEQMKLFKDAARYATRMMSIPEKKALYAKGITTNKNAAYRVAHTDYLNPPVIHYVRARGYTGKAGDLVTVKATDDFRVAKVTVTMYGSDGKVLEKGDAVNVRLKPFMWRYRTTKANPKVEGSMIKAIAFDFPGNECEMNFSFD